MGCEIGSFVILLIEKYFFDDEELIVSYVDCPHNSDARRSGGQNRVNPILVNNLANMILFKHMKREFGEQ